MSDWKNRTVKSIAYFNPAESIATGKLVKKIPMGCLQTFTRKIVGYEIAKYKSGPKFRNGDTLLSKITPCLENGKTAYVDILDEEEVAFGSSEYIVLRARDKRDSLFLYYLAVSPTFRKRAISCMEGTSGRKRVNENVLKYYDMLIPDLLTRNKIALALSSFDSKIELNNRINAELEAMVKILYNYWFVQFDFPDKNGKPYKSSGGKMVYSDKLKRKIPEGWGVLLLDDVITRSGTGLNPRDNFKLGSGNNFYVTIKNIDNGKIILDNRCDKVDDEALNIINQRSDLRPGDVLFTSIEPVGVTYLLQEKPTNWNINESVFTLRPNFEKITSEYLFMLLSSTEMKAFTKNVSAGSIHKGVRHGVLKTFKLPYGQKSLIDDFSKILSPILKKIDKLDKENQKLVEFRDWLLPMLMNGQVRAHGAS